MALRFDHADNKRTDRHRLGAGPTRAAVGNDPAVGEAVELQILPEAYLVEDLHVRVRRAVLLGQPLHRELAIHGGDDAGVVQIVGGQGRAADPGVGAVGGEAGVPVIVVVHVLCCCASGQQHQSCSPEQGDRSQVTSSLR